MYTVAPRTGAWIETLSQQMIPLDGDMVAPRTGAWIETQPRPDQGADGVTVAPRTGAWIETEIAGKQSGTQYGRAPHGRVD